MKSENLLVAFLHLVLAQNNKTESNISEDEVFINQDGHPIGLRCTFDNGWCPGFFNKKDRLAKY